MFSIDKILRGRIVCLVLDGLSSRARACVCVCVLGKGGEGNVGHDAPIDHCVMYGSNKQHAYESHEEPSTRKGNMDSE